VPHKSMDTMKRVDYNNYLRKMRGAFHVARHERFDYLGNPGGVRRRRPPKGGARGSCMAPLPASEISRAPTVQPFAAVIGGSVKDAWYFFGAKVTPCCKSS